MEFASKLSDVQLMDLLLDAVCVVDVEGRYLYVNAAFEQIFGYRPEEVIGLAMIELVHPQDRERTLLAATSIMAGQPRRHFENRYVRKDGRIVHIMWSAQWSESEKVRIAVARDITARKRAETIQAAVHAISEATHVAADLNTLFRQIHQVISTLLPATNFRVTFFDPVKEELSFPYCSDVRRSEIRNCHIDAEPRLARVIRQRHPLLLNRGEAEGGPREADEKSWLGIPLIGETGVQGALSLSSYSDELCYSEKDMEALQIIGIQVMAAVERKRLLSQLEHSALYDSLTELPNRRLFHDRLQTALVRSRREGRRLSLLYLDIDLFKQVNDTFGHAMGDLLLQEVASRLKHCVRESDTVGRIGGDEFLLLLGGLKGENDTLTVAEKVRAALCRPFVLDGEQFTVSPSIGVAQYPEHGDDYRQLIRYADEAMYRAKQAGGNRTIVWSPKA